MPIEDPLDLAIEVARLFEGLGIEYLLRLLARHGLGNVLIADAHVNSSGE